MAPISRWPVQLVQLNLTKCILPFVEILAMQVSCWVYAVEQEQEGSEVEVKEGPSDLSRCTFAEYALIAAANSQVSTVQLALHCITGVINFS